MGRNQEVATPAIFVLKIARGVDEMGLIFYIEKGKYTRIAF